MTAGTGSTPSGAQTARAALGAAHFPRTWVLVLSVFSALSCISGGMELVLWHRGNRYLPPLDTLRYTPFQDYLGPGVILALVVGGLQLVCALRAFERAASAPLACVFAGGSLSAWVLAEAAMLRRVDALHALYLAVGVALLGLGVRAALASGEVRARWLVFVTGGELLGFAVPAATGITLSKLGAEGTTEIIALGLAGACEGLLLGAAQAWAWPLPVRRGRYALLTASAAALVWVAAMSLVQLAAADHPPRALLAAVGGVTAILGLLSIGTAQWFELRNYTRTAWRFVAWTALAWLLALPFSFAPGPFVDASTPFGVQLTLWSLGGLLMAVVMALITWCGVRRVGSC